MVAQFGDMVVVEQFYILKNIYFSNFSKAMILS